MSSPNFPVDIIKLFRLGFLIGSLAFFMTSSCHKEFISKVDNETHWHLHNTAAFLS